MWHYSFAKKLGCPECKNAQSTIKPLLNMYFSSDLVHFLNKVGGVQAALTKMATAPLSLIK